MNMQSLMAQAQRVQKELETAQKEIENTTFIGESGAIKVEVKGNNKVIKYEVLDDEVLKDKDLLQDMTIVALNNAFDKIEKMKQQKLGKYTGGLGGLF